MKRIWPLCLILMLVFSFNLAYADDIIIKINTGGQSSAGTKAENDQQSGDVIMSAMSLLGVPYVFGGNTPTKGLDCSGFIKYIFDKSMKVSLPRTSAAMGQTGQPIARDNIQPGDLVFFNTRGFANSHVGLYIGSNKFLHAPRTGKTVEVANMGNTYWSKRYNGARRIDKNQRIYSVKAEAKEKPAVERKERQAAVEKKEKQTAAVKKTATTATKTAKKEPNKKTTDSKASSKKTNTKKVDSKTDKKKEKPVSKKEEASKKKTATKKETTPVKKESKTTKKETPKSKKK